MQSDAYRGFLGFTETLLLASLLVLVGLAVPCTQARAAEIVVQEGGSIYDAVYNASAGDTIQVESGTYYETEMLSLSMSLLLHGVDTGGGAPVIDRQDGGDIFQITASGCTVEGFVLRNPGSGSSAIRSYTGNLTVRNNVIEGNVGYGIRFSGSSVTVENNTVTGASEYAVYMGGSSHAIRGNTFQDCSNGINCISSSNCLFENNTFSNVGSYAFRMATCQKQVIRHNTIDGNSGSGILMVNTAGSSWWNEIYGNTITSCTGAAINVDNRSYGTRVFLNELGSSVTAGTKSDIWQSLTLWQYQYNGQTYRSYLGNRYYDYAGTDDDVNGIGDASYEVNSVVTDEYPLAGVLSEYTDLIEVLPDLSANDITPSEVTGAGVDTTVTATVNNTGLADAGGFSVALYVDGELVDTQTVDSLASGTSTTVTFYWVPEAIDEGVELTVVVDTEDAVEEINEDDNETAGASPVEVVGSDLTVTGVSVPEEVNTGERVTVTITVANTGDVYAEEFTVGLYCDMSPVVAWAAANPDKAAKHPGLFEDEDSVGLVGSVTVGSLAAGASVEVVIPWVPAVAGVRTVGAMADVGGDVIEYDDTNNMADPPEIALVRPYAGTVTVIDPGDSLQGAVGGAAAGDTIVLNPGTYELDYAGGNRRLSIGVSNLTLKAAGEVVVDGVSEADIPRLVWEGSEVCGTVFDGIEFVNVAVSPSDADRSGLTFKNCRFRGGSPRMFGEEDGLINAGGMTAKGCVWAPDVSCSIEFPVADAVIEACVFDGCSLAMRNPSDRAGFAFRNNMVTGVSLPGGEYNAFLRLEGEGNLVEGNVFLSMAPGEGNPVVDLVGTDSIVRENRFNELSGDGYTLLENGSDNLVYRNDFLCGDNPMLYGDPVLWIPDSYSYTYREQTYYGLMGNHYSSYSGSDSDGDGIGDSSVSFNGATDEYPLVASFSEYTDMVVIVPNLTVDSVGLPDHVYAGLAAEVTARITNDGAEASAFQAVLYADNQVIETRSVDGLGLGRTVELIFTWTPESASQGMSLRVAADTENSVTESDETDNDATAESVVVGIPSRMYLEPSVVRTSNGEVFSVEVRVDTGDFVVAGAQFNLTFDPSILEITGVTEGSLLNQDGAGTYFSGGTLDNDSGSLSDVVGAITSSGAYVTTGGVFAVVSFLAKGDGTSTLGLSNAIVGDNNAEEVVLIVDSGGVSTIVTYSATGRAAYGGGQTGTVYAGLYSDSGLTSAIAGPVSTGMGEDVSFGNLAPGSGYSFGAFLDSDEDGVRDASEAWGAVQFDIVSEDVTGLTVILADSDLDTDNLPDYWEALYSGYDDGAGIGGPVDDPDQDGYTNSWECTNGTDPTVQDEAGGDGYDSATDRRVTPDGWSVIRSHGYYLPGRSFEVTLTIRYSGDVTALAVTETIPEGWGYVSAQSEGSMNVSQTGDGDLEFSWLSLPEEDGEAVNPFSFTYTLSVPEDAQDPVTFSGTVLFCVGGGDEESFDMEDTVAEVHAFHSADYKPADWCIDISELLRAIQIYNVGAYHCDNLGEDGFNPGTGDFTDPAPHSGDYNPCDGIIGVSELLRIIQIYNVGSYHVDTTGEDGFRPGVE